MGKKKGLSVTHEPPKKSLFGGFADPASYISQGDPYEKEEIIPSRYLGANFKVAKPKKGHTADVYFEKKFNTLASSQQHPTLKQPDLYIDPGRRSRLDAQEAKKKNIDKSRDFKFASPGKKSTGPGSYFGSFQPTPFEHMNDYNVPKKEDHPPRPNPQLPNIKTAVGKKGTYGFVGTTFSKIEPTEKSKADIYDKLRLDERAAWQKSKELIKKISEKTFRATCRSVNTFDEKNYRGITSVYDAYEPPEDKKSKKAKKKPKKQEKVLELGPFKYASGPKSGETGYFSPFANRRGQEPDPQAQPKKASKKAVKEEPKPLGGAWKPVSGQKSSVIRSLLRRFY